MSNLAARVSSAVDLITSSHKDISRDSLRFAATSFYYKLKAADGYVPAAKYHGDVLLLRAKTNSQYEQNLGADYKLGEVWKTVFFQVFSNSFCLSNSPLQELRQCKTNLNQTESVTVTVWPHSSTSVSVRPALT